MAAKSIAGMARSYRYPKADRRDCLQFAARQRGVWTSGDLLQNQSGYIRGSMSARGPSHMPAHLPRKQLQLLMPPTQVVQAHADAQ
jgi:hypothetical protein